MRCALAAACLGSVLRLSEGQIYTFESVPVPAERSLHTLYAFYVYSLAEAPERGAGMPFVKFSQLRIEPSAGGADMDMLKDYEGYQLSIMRYSDFWDLVDPKKFCSTEQDAATGKAEKKGQLLVRKESWQSYRDLSVYSYTVRTAPAQLSDVKEFIGKTGVYILVFSNCGSVSQGTVSGTVVVKNAYGFLPGNEYQKMPFYGWMLVVYVVLAVVWMGLSIRWWKELFMIQNCIAVVILFGLLESFLWFMFYHDWNQTGLRGKFLFVSAILFTVVKSTFSYMLVLVGSLGWGVTRPYLDTKVIWKIQALSFFYIVLDFIREAVLAFRHSHSLSLSFVLLCLLPVSLLNGVIFSWVFSALSNLMSTLKERRQSEKLALFQKLWRILLFALTIATLTLLFQIFNLSRSITSRWQSQWLLSDGVSHGLFLLVLMAMMFLWAPNKASQRYAYSQQIGGDDELEQPGAIWADEDDENAEEGEDGDTFWSSTKGAKASGSHEHAGGISVIGAGAA